MRASATRPTGRRARTNHAGGSIARQTHRVISRQRGLPQAGTDAAGQPGAGRLLQGGAARCMAAGRAGDGSPGKCPDKLRRRCGRAAAIPGDGAHHNTERVRWHLGEGDGSAGRVLLPPHRRFPNAPEDLRRRGRTGVRPALRRPAKSHFGRGMISVRGWPEVGFSTRSILFGNLDKSCPA